jgi:hypothetical protein
MISAGFILWFCDFSPLYCFLFCYFLCLPINFTHADDDDDDDVTSHNNFSKCDNYGAQQLH